MEVSEECRRQPSVRRASREVAQGGGGVQETLILWLTRRRSACPSILLISVLVAHTAVAVETPTPPPPHDTMLQRPKRLFVFHLKA